MDDLQVRVALAVCETGSFTKAAKTIPTSVPNAKNQVEALERELGCELFVRTNHGCTPTAAGERLLDESPSLLQQMDRFRATVRGDFNEQLRILAVNSAEFPKRDELCNEHMRRNPGSLVRIVVPPPQYDMIYDSVNDGFADIGIISDEAAKHIPLDASIFVCQGWTEGWRCIYRTDSRLAGLPQPLALKDVSQERVAIPVLERTNPFANGNETGLTFERNDVINWCRAGGAFVCGTYFDVRDPGLTSAVIDLEPYHMALLCACNPNTATRSLIETARTTVGPLVQIR